MSRFARGLVRAPTALELLMWLLTAYWTGEYVQSCRERRRIEQLREQIEQLRRG